MEEPLVKNASSHPAAASGFTRDELLAARYQRLSGRAAQRRVQATVTRLTFPLPTLRRWRRRVRCADNFSNGEATIMHSKPFVRAAFVSVLLGICAAGTVSADTSQGRQPEFRGGRDAGVQLGPRPFFLVKGMDDGPLKSRLLRCENGPFH